MSRISLKFADFELRAELFDTEIARGLQKLLPLEIELVSWGSEVYGPIGQNLGTENPQPRVEAGALAYTNQGNYFCIFYGQQPAWPVEIVGQLESFQQLRMGPPPAQVRVSLVE